MKHPYKRMYVFLGLLLMLAGCAGTGGKVADPSLESGILSTLPEEFLGQVDLLQPVFNHDFSKAVYKVTLRDGRKQIIVSGDKKGREYDEVRNVLWSPDGTTFAYVAQLRGEQFVVVGEEEMKGYASISDITFSDDSDVIGYRASSGSSVFLVVEEEEREAHRNIRSIMFQPHGQEIAYIAVDDTATQESSSRAPLELPVGLELPANDAVPGMAYETYGLRQKTDELAPSSRRERVIIGTWSGSQFASIQNLSFRTDGRTVTYQVKKGTGASIIVGNRMMPAVQRLWGPVFRDDGAFVIAASLVGQKISRAVEKVREEDLLFAAPQRITLRTSSLSALIKKMQDPQRLTRVKAVKRIAQLGPKASKAMPALIEACKDKDPQIRRYAALALGNLGPEANNAVPVLLEALRDDNDRVRSSAAKALGNIGSAAHAALPSLLGLLADPEARYSAAYAIDQLITPDDTNALGLLVFWQLEETNDWETAELLAAAAGKITTSENMKQVIALLRQALGASNNGEFEPASKALASRNSEIALDVFILTVQYSSRPQAREYAVRALREYGTKAEKAIPILLAAMDDTDKGVRGSAAYALGRIGKNNTSRVVPILIEALQSEDSYIQEWAVNALTDIGPAAKDAVPLLIAIQQDENNWIRLRNSATHALRSIGTPEARAVVDTQKQKVLDAVPTTLFGRFMFTTDDESDGPYVWEITNAATRELQHLSREEQKKLVPQFIAAIRENLDFGQDVQNPKGEVVRRAVFGLEVIAPVAEDAVPTLYEVLRRTGGPFSQTFSALVAIGDPAIPYLTDRAQNESDLKAREYAERVLQRIKEK